ncbi:TetR/AcrR family transcriptional regulator [Labrys neptuniae]
MARPLSEAKRQAILASAVRLVASMGVGAPTAKIAYGAEIAEGTLFKYFANKDELLNQLYVTIKAELGATILEGFAPHAGIRERGWHIWSRWIDWGADYPLKRQAMRQLRVSERITQASKEAGHTAFHDVSAAFQQAHAEGPLRDQPLAFMNASFEALVETTLEFIARDPQRRDDYKQAGFQIFWNGVGS